VLATRRRFLQVPPSFLAHVSLRPINLVEKALYQGLVSREDFDDQSKHVKRNYAKVSAQSTATVVCRLLAIRDIPNELPQPPHAERRFPRCCELPIQSLQQLRHAVQ